MECFNTASGKYCCNVAMVTMAVVVVGVSIPQAVSTVATDWHPAEYGKYFTVSIPQAVSTVATESLRVVEVTPRFSFNTASGKYCCN